ncbi:hypothetical protein KGO06_00575 [Patescibacteria group bacterium]|nr:hypothetical protein [Patescibacteria group bacterium]
MGDKIKAFFVMHSVDIGTVVLVSAALFAAYFMGQLSATDACGTGFSFTRYDRP